MSDRPLRSLSRIWSLLHWERRDLRLVFLFALFISVLSLATPITIEALVNTVTFGVAMWPVIWLAVIMLFCLGFAALIQMLETWVIELLQQRLFVRVVADFAYRLPRVRLDAYEEQHGPQLLNHFFDLMTVQKSTAALLLDGTRIIIATVVGLIVLSVYHPLLLAFAIGLILMLIVLFLLGFGGVRTSIDESEAKYRTAAWLQQITGMPRTFKTGAGPGLALQRSHELIDNYVSLRRRHFSVVFRQVIFSLGIQVAASVSLLGLGGYLVIQQQLTLGQLVAAELIVALVAGNLAKAGKYLEHWYDLCTGMTKLGYITDLPIERLEGEPMLRKDGGIDLAVQTMGYNAAHTAIGEVTWQVAANERVAIAGPVGSGKTAILDIIAGLRDPDSGRVLLDGVDLRDLQLESVRGQVAMVHAIEIFTGTIDENIKAGRDIDPTAIRQALQTVRILDTVHAMPDGIHTALNPSGFPLSPGLALRLMLARAMVGRPRLLILDGILDVMDPVDDNALFDTLFDRTMPWTLVIVSRRPEILARCDRVITIGAGH